MLERSFVSYGFFLSTFLDELAIDQRGKIKISDSLVSTICMLSLVSYM